jgi:multidrug efflux pump
MSSGGFAIFVRRPVLATALNLVLLILGLVAYHYLEWRHLPKTESHVFQIYTAYPGANSAAIERQLTKPLEDALSGLDGIKTLEGMSEDGASTITVHFRPGIQSDKALAEVRDRVFNAVSTLPEAVKRPVIQEQTNQDTSLLYILFKDSHRSPVALADYVHRMIEDRLRLIEGVASLHFYGDQRYIVSIEPDPARLFEHQLGLQAIVEALKKERVFASGGELEGLGSKESVLISAAISEPKDLGLLSLKTAHGSLVRLDQVATIKVRAEVGDLRFSLDGQDVLQIGIIPKSQANPLIVAKAVKVFVEKLQAQLPPSMTASVTFDATQPFLEAFLEMKHVVWEAFILVTLIMLIALGSARAALLAMITIPLCLIGSFAILYAFDFSINPVTCLALILSIGLVVDDAIVVIENIYRHLAQGKTALDAAKASMQEISFSIVVMTLILASVYMPLLFQASDTSIIFKEFAWTLAGSVFISGFVALTLTPALCGKYSGSKPTHHRYWRALEDAYKKILSILVIHPKKIALVLLVIAGLAVSGLQYLPSEAIPVEDESYLSGMMMADNSVAPAVQKGWQQSVGAILEQIPEREKVMFWHYRQWHGWFLVLKPPRDRKRHAQAIRADLTEQLRKVVGPQVTVNTDSALGDSNAMKVIIQYAGDPLVLSKAVQAIMVDLRKQGGIQSVSTEQPPDVLRLKVAVDRAVAAELGIGVETIEETVFTLLSGHKVSDFYFEGLDYDVKVRAAPNLRTEASDLNRFFVAGSDGQWVPLGSVVRLNHEQSTSQIKHFDRVRGVALNLNLEAAADLDTVIKGMVPIMRQHLPRDAQYHFAGQLEVYQSGAKTALWTFLLALAFIYLVLAALFESFVDPVIILLTVPLSLAGAVTALLFYGGTNNAYTLIALMTLMGLIAKHGILIVDFANRLSDTQGPKEAIMHAAVARLRPILMTTFAMIGGAIPLVLSVGAGAVARQHIAWVIIGGMLMGTILSLFVVPVIYGWVKGLDRSV